MKKNKIIILLLIILLSLGINHSCLSQQLDKSFKWYKGNTHTHTLNSDGDSTPADVVQWYREHGYNFLVITDHDYLTNVDGLNAMYGAEGQFIVIKGVEVSDRFGDKPIHLNCLYPDKVVLPTGGASIVETIQYNVDAIRNVSGVPHINHPNYKWAIGVDELKQIENCNLFEIYSGHPVINNCGGGGMPSVEEIWDDVLTSGKLFYGVAVDDAHTFKQPWNKNAARPGQGWIMVRAKSLTPETLMEAIERGDFYASTGVELKKYQVNETGLQITIKAHGDTKYRVRFIGKNGKVFKEDISNPAVYQFKGDEMYIRAKIIDSNGRVAWTQPVMIGN